MEDQYYDIQRRTEIKDTARELRRSISGIRMQNLFTAFSIRNFWN